MERLLVTIHVVYSFLKRFPQWVQTNFSSKPVSGDFVKKYNLWLQDKRDKHEEDEVQPDPQMTFFSVTLCFSEDDIFDLFQSFNSLKDQVYSKMELILVAISPLSDEAKSVINEKIEHLPFDVFLVPKSKNINQVALLNRAIDMVRGEFIFFMNAGDVFESHTLFTCRKQLREYSACDLLYVDEGIISDEGEKITPVFKPDWNPDTFLSVNYIGSGVFYRTSMVKALGKFDPTFPEAYLYDMSLKITDTSDHIEHLSEVLFHKKASVIVNLEEGKNAIENALTRRRLEGDVIVNKVGAYDVRYRLEKENDKVSIVIPSRNQGKILDNCLKSIYEVSSYKNYEVIILDNGSDEVMFFQVVKKWKEKLGERFKVIELNVPFNYAKINNYAANAAEGQYLLFLNNDVEVLEPKWMEHMMQHAQRPTVGAVGAKLLYPNDRLQHAGVVFGVDGVASHAFINQSLEDARVGDWVNKTANYSALTGACMMIRTALFFEMGGFDEEYEVDFNDYDLCLRLIDKGYFNVYTPLAVLYHYESYSRGSSKFKDIKTMMRYRREKEKFEAHWKHYIENDPSYNRNFNRELEKIFEPEFR